jgi:DHA1 family inner membrane transport protein
MHSPAHRLLRLIARDFRHRDTKFADVGLLPDTAASLDVSISRAGLLVGGYAVGVAIDGPAIVAITTSQPRKWTLLQLCAIFVVGHMLAALAPDYGFLMAARVLAAISRASFLGIAAIVAASSVPPERSARAVSLVWLGFSAANLVGVPGATAIGHAFDARDCGDRCGGGASAPDTRVRFQRRFESETRNGRAAVSLL